MAHVDGAVHKCNVIASFREALCKEVWAQASSHAHRSGISDGADLQLALRAKASLVNEGNYLAAKALDLIVCDVLKDPYQR